MTPDELQLILDEWEGQKIEFKEAVSSTKNSPPLPSFGGRIFLRTCELVKEGYNQQNWATRCDVFCLFGRH